jgi:hypothetical protein
VDPAHGLSESEGVMTRQWKFVAAGCFVALMGVSAAADQAPQLSRIMPEKLDHSQAILAGVIKSDWPTLERESRALALVVRDPAWMVQLTSPEYLRQSDAFQKALQDLILASGRRDLDEAANAHVALTLSCVRCHVHMTRQRVAR